jgi:hypothetical protein
MLSRLMPRSRFSQPKGDVIADLRKKIANTDPLPKQINNLGLALTLPFCGWSEEDD